ncbi:MAG: phosphoenolpyruvate--protein phosphotransferase [Planctomycetota bacterium]|nr:MAG: phosphoenolpyruvate--protein phosphotransferase [Planctomycetota bacterium]
MRVLNGKPVSPGYAKGVAFVYNKNSNFEVNYQSIEQEQIHGEFQRFQDALQKSSHELKNIRQKVLSELGQSESQIFAAHLALLNDKRFISKVKNRIERDLVSVEHSLDEEVGDLITLLSYVENEYLRERASDVKDVSRRILKHLGHGYDEILHNIKPGTILVAEELLPSDTLKIDRNHINAIITELGGDTSHTAILARSLGIPAVTGIPNACTEISDGSELLVDGETGIVTISSHLEDSDKFSVKKERYDKLSTRAESESQTECITEDGVEICLFANIGRPEESLEIKRNNLKGVGLFRTECLFLLLNKPPTVEEQVFAYSSVASNLQNMPVHIRTLDLGGDKKPLFLSSNFENNPNLGARGLRFSLLEKELLQIQLQAVIQSNTHGNIKIMFPMVIGGDDLAKAIDCVHAAHDAVKNDRVPEIGAMIETPSALFQLDEILELADFISIGTNDLAQFILAADRNAVDLLSDDSILHPSVLRAISQIIDSANQQNCPVCICGEAAGNPTIACLLIGMGIRQLSMSPIRSARVRMMIRQCQVNILQELAGKALNSKSPEQVVNLVEQFEQNMTLYKHGE